jgi:hypothetical protein
MADFGEAPFRGRPDPLSPHRDSGACVGFSSVACAACSEGFLTETARSAVCRGSVFPEGNQSDTALTASFFAAAPGLVVDRVDH